jgi:hypothetical protein
MAKVLKSDTKTEADRVSDAVVEQIRQLRADGDPLSREAASFMTVAFRNMADEQIIRFAKAIKEAVG